MPMFFMLSGFALAATYGKTLWAAPAASPSPRLPAWCCRRRNRRTAAAEAAVMVVVEEEEEGRGGNENETGAAEQEQEQEPLPPFPLRAFYQNRFARVMPVYYFTLLLCLPLWVVNVGDIPFARRTFALSFLTSALPSTTLFSPLSGTYLATLNPPGGYVTHTLPCLSVCLSVCLLPPCTCAQPTGCKFAPSQFDR